MRLSRGRQCHYCGIRNRPQDVQRFQCTNCLADNFYDENGEIADVPPEVARASEPSYVAPASHNTSQSIFCSVCLKNQNLYTDALSNFLPDPSDPSYAQYEAALPEYKKRIELQYPQCCTICEPKVREQLQQATYTARSDHLRRVLDKSRSTKPPSMLQSRYLVLKVTQLLYLGSLMIQLAWHLSKSQASTTSTPNVRPTDCLALRPAPECSAMAEPFVGPALIVGLFCSWWNPIWQHKLQKTSGRLIGLARYYWMQAFVMAIRFGAWVIPRDLPMSDQNQRMLHSVSFVLLVVMAVYMHFGTIKIDDTPLVNWQQSPAPLVTDGQFTSHTQPQYQAPDALLESLQTVHAPLQSWNPPTPPDEDTMDWTPSSTRFSPQPKSLAYKPVQPSPFVGTIPALSSPGIYASKAQHDPEPVKAIGIPQGFFDNRTQLPSHRATSDKFAPPKFFANSNDTGLEGMFGTVFSLVEDAPEVRARQDVIGMSDPSTSPVPTPALSPQQVFRLLTFLAAGSIAAYTTFNICTEELVDSRLVLVLGLVPTANIVHDFTKGPSVTKLLAWITVWVEIVALRHYRPDSQSLLSPLWDKLIVATAYLLAAHEILLFCATPARTSLRSATPPVQAAPTTMTESVEPHEPPLVETPFTPKPDLFRRDSTESVASSASSMSTSTSSTWRTPTQNPRMTSRVTRSMRSDRARDYGMDSLGFENFSIGTTVAGRRNR